MSRRKLRMLLLELFMIICAVVFFYPLYLVFVNSFKRISQILIDSAGWPTEFAFTNYARAWEMTNFPVVFMNSFQITVFSNLGIVIFSSMCAWRLVRRPGRWSNVLFFSFVAAMIVPFQSVMIPLIKVGHTLGMINSIPGVILMYIGFGLAISVFFYHGFIKSIPLELEEAAIIDGCNIHRLFWNIVFPLLKPITMTVLILNTLWIWNDFLLAVIMLHDRQYQTIPIATYMFFTMFYKQWDYALATIAMSIVPIIIFYLLLQRNIIRGVMAGSVKG